MKRSPQKTLLLALLGATGLSLLAATATLTPAPLAVPPGWPAPTLPADNPLTREGIELGKLLFADKRLSARHRQNCINCHREPLAFSDGQVFSTGADGIQGLRSSPPIFNQAWHPSFGWDGIRPRLRDQALAAITNEIEMHAAPATVEADLNKDETLRARFATVFSSPEITMERIGLALEQFMLSISAYESKYDRVLRGDAAFTPDEQLGHDLFHALPDHASGRRGAGCFQCHPGPLFSDFAFRNNGLDRVFADNGRSDVTKLPDDLGKFKTPSLRNVAITAPYMHNGRFGTLELAVAHYSGGIRHSATLAPELAALPANGYALTTEEQSALVAFLKTLTETSLTR
ncbi:cytochrome-c peroxidase [Nibricoccus aquaticus]|uniref:cytochrome-c peroxidase n=1 Tax=Nibricoccus aquaticus TaxID=2576891 RepID=UPI001585D97A|nr:cytochrome c peroxidase [Nibricoccus aquaticus]